MQKFILSTRERPRALAKSLKALLQEEGATITLSKAQAAVSRMLGYRDWHDLGLHIGKGDPSTDDAFCDVATVEARRGHQIAVLMDLGCETSVAERVVTLLHPTCFVAPSPTDTIDGYRWPWNRNPRARPSFVTDEGRCLSFDPVSGDRPGLNDLIVGETAAARHSLICAGLLAQAHGEIDHPFRSFRTGIITTSWAGYYEGVLGLLGTRKGLSRIDGIVRISLENTKRHRVNPFDTEPGSRVPTISHLNVLAFLLMQIGGTGTTGPGQSSDRSRMIVIAREMYRLFDDHEQDSRPHPYKKGTEPEVDKALKRFGVNPQGLTWWEVTDLLLKANDIHSAIIAQRHAVPNMSDLKDAILDGRIEKLETEHPGIVEAARIIAERCTFLRILSGPTRLDIRNYSFAVVRIVDQPGTSKLPGIDAILTILARFLLLRSGTKAIMKGSEEARLSGMELLDTREPRVRTRLVYDVVEHLGQGPVDDVVRMDMGKASMSGGSVAVLSDTTDKVAHMQYLSRNVWICGRPADRDRLISDAQVMGFRDAKAIGAFLDGGRENSMDWHRVLLRIGDHDGFIHESAVDLTFSAVERWAVETDPLVMDVRQSVVDRIGTANALEGLAENFPLPGAADGLDRYRIADWVDAQLSHSDVLLNDLLDAIMED